MHNLKRAQSAASIAGGLAFWHAIVHLWHAHLLVNHPSIFALNSKYSEEYLVSWGLVLPTGFVAFSVLFIIFSYRILRMKKYGSVPFIALFALSGYWDFLNKGGSAFISIIFFILAIISFIGWFSLRAGTCKKF